MKISLKQLEEIFQLLLDKVSESEMFQDSGVKEIEFPYDFYWSVPIGERSDIYKAKENDIGSIDHDIERLLTCLERNNPNSHDFRYLGNILIAVGDTLEYNKIFL